MNRRAVTISAALSVCIAVMTTLATGAQASVAPPDPIGPLNPPPAIPLTPAHEALGENLRWLLIGASLTVIALLLTTALVLALHARAASHPQRRRIPNHST
jgi:hypothetical protein